VTRTVQHSVRDSARCAEASYCASVLAGEIEARLRTLTGEREAEKSDRDGSGKFVKGASHSLKPSHNDITTAKQHFEDGTTTPSESSDKI
jgi:hypothetical protein